MAAVRAMEGSGPGSGLGDPPAEDNSPTEESASSSKNDQPSFASGAISKTNIKKRQEQLQRWELSETNKYPDEPKKRDSEVAVVGTDSVRNVKFQPSVTFLAACSARDLKEVDRLLRNGTDINSANVDGLTALHQACIDNSFEVFKYLVDNGCDVNAQDSEGWTALHAAASCGFLEMTRYLISHSAKLDIVNSDGDLAVDLAESMNIKNLISAEMLTQGIDCDAARRREELLLAEHARQWMIEGYNEKPDPLTGATALHVASSKGYVDVIKVLLDAGADINAQDFEGWTPLHAASHWAQKEATKILADNMADFEIITCSGETVLDLADEEIEEYVKELQKAQEKIKQDNAKRDVNGANVLRHMFKEKRRSSITRLSLEQRQSMQTKNSEEERAQMEAAMRQNVVVEVEDEVKVSVSDSAIDQKSAVKNTETRASVVNDTAQKTVEASTANTSNSTSTRPISTATKAATTTTPAATATAAAAAMPAATKTPAVTTTPATAITPAATATTVNSVPLRPTSSISSTAGTSAGAVPELQLRRTSQTDAVKPREDSTSLTPVKRHSVPVSGYAGSPAVPPTASLSARLNALSCHVASITSRGKSGEALPTPRRLDLRKFGSFGSTSGEDLSNSGAQSEQSVAPGSSVEQDTNKSTIDKTGDVGGSEGDTGRENAPRTRPLLSSATTAALAEIANQRRSIEMPKRDEAKEVERRLRARKARESRRSTQGVTKEDMESAEAALQAAAAAAASSSIAESTAVSDTSSTVSLDSTSSGAVASVSSSGSSTSSTIDIKSKAEAAGASEATAAAKAQQDQQLSSALSRLTGRYPWSDRRESDSTAELRRSQNPGVTISSPTSSARREFRNSVPVSSHSDAMSGTSSTRNTATPAAGRANISSYRSKYLQEKEAREGVKTPQDPSPPSSKAEDPALATQPGPAPTAEPPVKPPHVKSDACPCADCDEANQTSAIAAAIRAKRKRESRRPTGRISFDSSATTHTSEEVGGDEAAAANEEISEITRTTEDKEVLPSAVLQAAQRLQSVRPASASSLSALESTIDYKKLYELQHNSNQRLREDIQELKQELVNCRSELALARTSAGVASAGVVTSEQTFDQRDRRALERKISELEEELKSVETLKLDNQRLKEENGALIRVISKLSK